MSTSEPVIKDNFLKEAGFELGLLKESITRWGKGSAKALKQEVGSHAGGTATTEGTQKAKGLENIGEMWKEVLGSDHEHPQTIRMRSH